LKRRIPSIPAIDILAKFNNHRFVGPYLKSLQLVSEMMDFRQWL
jgi:hypothetical protein